MKRMEMNVQRTIRLLCTLFFKAYCFSWLFASCQVDKPEGFGTFVPEDGTAVTLGDIQLAEESEADTRTTTYTKLADGKTFRLYAFPRGETASDRIITSYTYTMKEGKPMMDANQGDGKLYLPYGKLDIYLVGPVSTATDDTEADGTTPVMASVAASTGVIPRSGVDLIASCTPVEITYSGTNRVNPVALKHKMAKVRVRVRRAEKYASMTRLELTKVELHNQANIPGEYTFNADGGTVVPMPADNIGGSSLVQSGTEILTREDGKEYDATFLVFPREKGYQKISVEMNATLVNPENPGSSGNTQLYRMSGILSEVAFVAGKQTLLFTEPDISNDILWRPDLLPWNQEEPITPPMGGDMILYLDGRDAPEMIDGKLCWRDRSGNGNHAEILSTDITYNKERMCYEFSSAKDKMQIPDLGTVPEYTVEMLVETVLGSGSELSFGNTAYPKRDLLIDFTYGNQINFHSGKNGTSQGAVSYKITDAAYYHTFHTYFFRKSSTTMSLGMNGKQVATATAYPHEVLNNNYIGQKSGLRIRSVRFYRKALTDAEVKENYEVDQTVYKQDPEVSNSSLLLHLDGKVAPYTNSDGDMFWPDISGNAHHAKYYNNPLGGKNLISYTGRGYRFNNVSASECSYMLPQNSLGKHTSYTLELVVKSERLGATVFHTGPRTADSDDRTIGIHLPFTPLNNGANNRIVFDGPRLTGGKYNVSGSSVEGGNQNRITYVGPYVNTQFTAQVHYYAFVRDNANRVNKLIVDGEQIASIRTNGTENDPTYANNPIIRNIPDSEIPEMLCTCIGNLYPGLGDYFIGEILAVRVYGRTLTIDEILKNSRADKARYKY